MSHDIPQVNSVKMDRDKLTEVLEYFGYRVGEHFSHNIRLVIHGGACMLLHPGLYNLAKQQAKMTPQMQIRRTTRDVDFLHRAFASEMTAFNGDSDAPRKLQMCIRETAIRFGLGADWMNSDADVALPMAKDPSGRQYDPVHTTSTQKTNIEHYTAFTSANGMVTLISVAPFWAIAFKLARYNKWDPSDICLLLKYNTILSGTSWSKDYLERWLAHHCWAMGYVHFHPDQKLEVQNRIGHAVEMVNSWYAKTPSLEEFRSIGFKTHAGTGPGSSIDPATDSLGTYTHANRESVMNTKELEKFVWSSGDGSRQKPSFAGDWVKPNVDSSPSQPPQPVVYHHQSSSPQRQPSHGSVFPLSPPFSPDHGQTLATPGSVEQKNRPSNVTDWIAAGEALKTGTEEKKRRKLRERGRQRDKEQEVTIPFIPSSNDLSTGDHPHRRHQSEPIGHTWGQQDIHKTGLHNRRPQSQPPVHPRSRPAMYSIYSTPPPPNIYAQQNQSGAPTNGPLNTGNPSSHSLPTSYHPNPPYGRNGEHPHYMLYSMPPMNPKNQVKRKAKGTSSSKKTGDRASAQDRPQPTITPLTTVTYYNQQHQPGEHASPHVTPPQHGQFHQPSATLMQPYARSSVISIPYQPTQMVANIPQFTYPIPPLMSNHRPVIPTDEYLQPERRPGTFQKLISALKISA